MGTTDASSRATPAPLEVRTHPHCGLHRPPPGHPESPERLSLVLHALREKPVFGSKVVHEAALPEAGEILGTLKWVHDAEFIERVRAASATAPGTLDSDDCVVSSGTFDAAVTAAGLSLRAALDMANSRLLRAFLLCRPPGKHAERNRARGYCYFNNVALAAEVLARSWGAPVLIVNLGSHHANGVQQIFYDRADVGLVSVHAWPAFPGTGAADEVGEGRGRGTTRNMPLDVAADDAVVNGALEAAVEEVGSMLRPAAVLVCAGFDGHRDDPVGAWQLSTEGIGAMTRTLIQACETWSGGRCLSFLEGGFQQQALRDSAHIHVSEMAQIHAPD